MAICACAPSHSHPSWHACAALPPIWCGNCGLSARGHSWLAVSLPATPPSTLPVRLRMERFWRTYKYELFNLYDDITPEIIEGRLKTRMRYYNKERLLSAFRKTRHRRNGVFHMLYVCIILKIQWVTLHRKSKFSLNGCFLMWLKFIISR